MRYLTFIFLLAACGKAPDSLDFKHYVTKFLTEAENHGRFVSSYDVIITFGEIQDGGSGIFYDYFIPPSQTDEVATLIVKEEWWNNADEWDREIAMFHMLGHRVLDRDHRMDIEKGGSPDNSIMRYPFPLISEYLAHRADYLRELFLYQETPIREVPTSYTVFQPIDSHGHFHGGH